MSYNKNVQQTERTGAVSKGASNPFGAAGKDSFESIFTTARNSQQNNFAQMANDPMPKGTKKMFTIG